MFHGTEGFEVYVNTEEILHRLFKECLNKNRYLKLEIRQTIT